MKLQENESEVNSRFQWFLFAGVIPFIFATIFALVILTVAGVNVIEKAKHYGQNIPGISKLTKSDKSMVDIEEKLRNDIQDLEFRINDQVATISKLEKEAEQNKLEKEKLHAQIEKLIQDLGVLENQKKNTEQIFSGIAEMFESMSAQNAANILTELNDEEAIKIIKALSGEAVALIFENMKPAEAAKYTKQLTKDG